MKIKCTNGFLTPYSCSLTVLACFLGFVFLYPLKDYDMNLQPTLLYKITIPYSYTAIKLLETIPRGAQDYDYP